MWSPQWFTVFALWTSTSLASTDYLLSEYVAKLGKRVNDPGNYNVSFYHINDVHAHLDQFRPAGTDCTDPTTQGCVGGYARVKTAIQDARKRNNQSLFLNMGDEFQGTLYFTFYGGEKIAETLNQLNFDAMTIGNHEFDRGDDVLADFLANLTFPTVCANIQTNTTKLNQTISPYHIFPQHNLAVVGITTPTIPGISKPGPGTTFQDPTTVLQATVDYIRATRNITRIVAMTHIGYDEDIQLARNTRNVHLILGGHSHTLLGSMDGAKGPYPTIENNLDGEEVFVVTAYRWGEYLGSIDVTFDPTGKVVAYTGAPIHMTNDTAQEPNLQTQVEEWAEPFKAFAAEVIGVSDVTLDGTGCKTQECLLGDLIADAMLDYRRSDGSSAVATIQNGGGVRATIDQGDVTRGEAITSFPFGNAVVELNFTGAELLTAFEGIVSSNNTLSGQPVPGIAQVSKELRVTYNPTAASGKRLVSLTINGEAVQPNTTYPIVTNDYVAGGGDNYFLPTTQELVILDTLDDVLANFVNKTSPVNVQLDGRISVTNQTSA